MNTKVLVICNAYPSDQALYRNGFIHRRVVAYLEAGIEVDVFYNHEPIQEPYDYTFESVKVTVGNEAALEHRIRERKYDAYLVHFAEPTRIRPLIKFQVKSPVIIWVHGFEAEAWYRRWFNFMESPKAVQQAIAKKAQYYDGQNKFFHDLMLEDSINVSFVNVSEWFQKYIVEPDNHAEFSDSVVIPNIVDEEVFRYVEKEAAHRLKILSLRPYASMKYANDITVAAIIELSRRPYFNNLEFTLCGSGPLFDSTVKPLRQFKNVNLKNSFFSQGDIAELHRSHGIFLSPTRFDSQGVSMCEAMSSGLAVLSTNTAAVPEFISHGETGMLAKPEDPVDLADLIEMLYFDEELFLRLSQAGSRHIQRKCGRDASVGAEVRLINSKIEGAL